VKGATSAPVTLWECPRPARAGAAPFRCGEVNKEDESLAVELTRSGIDRVFLSFLGMLVCGLVTGSFPGNDGPFLNMDWGRNECMLIRERRFVLGEVDGSLDRVLCSSTSAEEAAGAPRSRGLQTR
jgi:hypothetical protein